jgi:hypothetical protein
MMRTLAMDGRGTVAVVEELPLVLTYFIGKRGNEYEE